MSKQTYKVPASIQITSEQMLRESCCSHVCLVCLTSHTLQTVLSAVGPARYSSQSACDRRFPSKPNRHLPSRARVEMMMIGRDPRLGILDSLI